LTVGIGQKTEEPEFIRREAMITQGLMMSHVVFGVLGILCGVAIFMDALNANERNLERIKKLSMAVAVFIILSYLIGGYWYVVFYGHDRDIIKAGQWPWAHNYFMEVKEHLFFIPLMLSIYLPVVAYRNDVLRDGNNRKLLLVISALIVLFGLFMEGAGGIISKGVTIGLMVR
jgi:hypothetical protein